MAAKIYELDETTTVHVHKRRGAKNIRLSVTETGSVRVTIPFWTPYAAGLAFAKSRLAWIRAHAVKPALLNHNHAVGKQHTLRFVQQPSAKKITSRVTANSIIIGLPSGVNSSDVAAQKSAKAACVRALKKQAQALLPARLNALATLHSFPYKSLNYKQLSSRWGSCDQHKNIIINIYVMQLPWQCIDYVLMHELVHTKVMHHGDDFWQLFERVLPNAKLYRKQLKQYQPTIMPGGTL